MKNFLCIFFFVISAVAQADNLRIHGGVKMTPVASGGVSLEVKVSWSNSWRNAYNYDAVYLFGKFRTEEGSSDWGHVYFDTTSSLQSATEGYTVKVVNEGRGVFVYRTAEQRGIATVALRLRWKIAGNASRVLTREQFDKKQVRVSMHGLEMVYVPASPFYAGDGSSGNSFSDPEFGTLPAAYDIIGTSTNYTYSGNGSETVAAYVNRPADRFDRAVYNANDRRDWCGTVMPATWQVDFKSPKTIRYFGVSGLCRQEFPPVPASDWYLEGSADARTWTDLWHGGPEYWGQSATSYPVQRAIRVTNPGAYRYYRVRVNDSQRAETWNNIHIANVAMSEVDLDTLDRGNNLLIDGYHRNFPDHYPLGVNGFYTMKYELTQEQYVVFLNQLSRSGQYTRTIGGLLDGIKEGEYVFGDSRNTPSHRNGIILLEHSLDGARPYVFACDLNPGNSPGDVDDGQAVACNYLSPADMLAYADWSGLRPLTELEYEKMCRGNYPSFPSGGEAAWGQSPPVFISGLVSEGRADESSCEADANVNAGGGVDGPVRVGMFVRPGKREQAGNSFWGISDLSGNLSEIYYNTDLYGRQLDGRVHGGGDLNVNGSAVTGRASWPVEAEAFGVRGGDYTSHAGQLAVSCRENMSGYFGDLEERRPTTGIRLGFAAAVKSVNSTLTLENGLESGSAIVYDTVCDASDYYIRGDRPEAGEICQYLWLSSTDQGDTWQTMEGDNEKDLQLSGLTDRVSANDVRQFLFKRLHYSANNVSESGVVALVVAHGFRVDKLKDTLQPCMVSSGFTVSTPLPAIYEWRCVDNGKILKTSEQSEDNSHYDLLTPDFDVEGKRPSGLYTIEVKITQAGGCAVHQKLEVEALPYTRNPFSSDVETFAYRADGQQITNIWGGSDVQVWKIVNEEKGTLEVSDRGLMSGLSTTLCSHVIVEAVCRDLPDRVYRKEMHEPERTLNYTANYFSISILPGGYLMECWGARGGTACQDWSTTAYGGLGGYASGEIQLDTTVPMYFYVGGYGGGNGAGPGWNGGGQGGANNDGEPGGSGGGASDIRLIPANLYSRIMVAGGGGGAGNYSTGPAGGGLSGSQVNAGAGTQVSGYTFGYGGTGGRDGSGVSAGGAGGGGYYGGYGAGTNAGPGGGGSGFISGMEGCDAVNEIGTHTGQPDHYSGFIFQSPMMKSGVKDGHGMIKITTK